MVMRFHFSLYMKPICFKLCNFVFECFLIRYQSPEDVYGEECDGQSNEADRLQATIKV